MIPSLTVTERYDSNVFFVPGRNLEDFVTSARPQLDIDHNGRFMEGHLLGGVTANAYAKNPELNYVMAHGGLSLNLDRMIRRMAPRAGLTVADNFQFTPEPSAFAAPPGTGAVPEAFAVGIQAMRANSFSNLGSATGTYALSPTVTLQAGYQHQMRRFGTAFARPEFGGFFRTTFQTVTAGPQWQISPRDAVSLSYQHLRAEFGSGGGFGGGFATDGGLLGWTRELTPSLKANVTGGVTVFAGTGDVQYLANASLDYTYEYGTAELTYARSVFPSFFIAGLPLLSQVARGSASYRAAQNLTLSGQVNYAKNESVPTPILRYESYGAGADASYTITRSMTFSAKYQYNEFMTRFTGRGFEFNRHQVMLTLRMEWK